METARQIRKIVGPDVTILILTAYDWSEIEQRARNAGIDNFMRKPVFVSNVIQAYDDARLQRHHVTKHQDYDFNGKKLLLVEDNKINSEIAKRLLELKGFEVDLAVNGVEAIEKFTKSKVGEYAAILMDIRMPYMDGLEATRTIRAIRKADAGKVPIVAMSANAFDEDVQKSLESGMNAHLSKPLDAELMYATLDKLIFKRRE
jgi:two-component system sensor histidine kinase/response regulator